MDNESIKIYCFVDSGYNTNIDHTSQIGMIIELIDKHNTLHFLQWSFAKCQRSTCSILVSEKYSFFNRFDSAVSLKMLFNSMGLKISLYLFTHAKSVFDTITASKRLLKTTTHE